MKDRAKERKLTPLRTEQTVAYLGLKKETQLYGLVARRKIPYRRIGAGKRGGRLVFFKEELDDWMREKLDDGVGLTFEEWKKRQAAEEDR